MTTRATLLATFRTLAIEAQQAGHEGTADLCRTTIDRLLALEDRVLNANLRTAYAVLARDLRDALAARGTGVHDHG